MSEESKTCYGIQVGHLIWAAESLTQSETLVLLAIASHMSDKDYAFPGYTSLSRKVRHKRRENTIRVVNGTKKKPGLVQKGILTVSDGRKSNTYHIATDKLWELIPSRAYEDLAKHGLYPPAGATSGDSRCYLQRQQGATSRDSRVLPPESPERTRERTLERSRNVPFQGAANAEAKARVRHSPPPDGLQPPDLIKNNDTIRELWENATCHLNNPVEDSHVFHPTTCSKEHMEKTAKSLEMIAIKLKSEKGRYPTPGEIASAVNSREFASAKSLSWGWLCSRYQKEVNGEVLTLSRADRLEEEIRKQMNLMDAARGAGSAPGDDDHDPCSASPAWQHHVEHMRREGASEQDIAEYTALWS
jgi:hypothetical protein